MNPVVTIFSLTGFLVPHKDNMVVGWLMCLCMLCNTKENENQHCLYDPVSVNMYVVHAFQRHGPRRRYNVVQKK